MAERDITVNINGNGSGGSGSPSAPAGGGGGGGDDTRLTASVSELVNEIRNAIAKGNGPGVGDSGFKDYLNNVGRSIVTQRQEEIRSRFDLTREQNYTKWSDEVSKLDAEREARASRYSFDARGQLWNPDGKLLPLGTTVSQDLDRWYNPRRQQIDADFGGFDERLASEESNERAAVERDMVDALRNVADALRRESREQSSNQESSYISRLRLERKQLLEATERATNEDDYYAAAARLQRFDAETAEVRNRALGGSSAIGRNVMAGVNVASSVASGDPVSTISGGAGLAAGLAGASLVTAAAVAAGVAAAGYAVTSTAKRIEETSTLANFRGLWGGNTGAEALGNAVATVFNARTRGIYGETITRKQLGIEDAEYMRRAAEMITTSGVLKDWNNRVFYTKANENTYNLAEGSLIRASRYERYESGETANSAMIKLVDQLEQLNERGVDTGIGGDLGYVRAQERLEIQQNLMEYYYSRYNRPDYNVANATQVAYSSQFGAGMVQDARMANAIQTVDAAVANSSGAYQMFALTALQDSELGRQRGFDKMPFEKLRWVLKNPQLFGISETELNTTFFQGIARRSGLDPETADFDSLFDNFGTNQALWELFGGTLPLEQLKQIIPGLTTGKTAKQYRASLAEARKPGDIADDSSLAMRANNRQLQNVTDMAGLRTMAGELVTSFSEFMTSLLAKVSGQNVEGNEIYLGE